MDYGIGLFWKPCRTTLKIASTTQCWAIRTGKSTPIRPPPGVKLENHSNIVGLLHGLNFQIRYPKKFHSMYEVSNNDVSVTACLGLGSGKQTGKQTGRLLHTANGSNPNQNPWSVCLPVHLWICFHCPALLLSYIKILN